MELDQWPPGGQRQYILTFWREKTKVSLLYTIHLAVCQICQNSGKWPKMVPRTAFSHNFGTFWDKNYLSTIILIDTINWSHLNWKKIAFFEFSIFGLYYPWNSDFETKRSKNDQICHQNQNERGQKVNLICFFTSRCNLGFQKILIPKVTKWSRSLS